MGTTNTRVWILRGREVVARAHANVGVRDTAREGTPARIRASLRELIAEVRKQNRTAGAIGEPSAVAAAGMITSPLGLAEVPHMEAPAGIDDLARGVRICHFPEITDLPILLIPGVRSGHRSGTVEEIVQSDVMRGEETLCLGLVALGLVSTPATVLNVGSHWKAIEIDPRGRIASSITSLSGELLQAAQTQTILASALPAGRPENLAETWCDAGMLEQRRSGLARALFCVRLLELSGRTTPEERLSFLVGVFVAADLDALRQRGLFAAGSRALITGSGAVAEAWRRALESMSVAASRLTEAEIEAGLLAGLRSVVAARAA